MDPACRLQDHAAAKAERDLDLSTAPPMERDEAAWQVGIAAQNGEPYGLAVFEFAEAWARLMQKRMASGSQLADVARATSHLADEGIGITGFMYGAAVNVLVSAWAHGEDLRRWRDSEFDDEDSGLDQDDGE